MREGREEKKTVHLFWNFVQITITTSEVWLWLVKGTVTGCQDDKPSIGVINVVNSVVAYLVTLR